MYKYSLFTLFVVIVVCSMFTIPIVSHKCSPSEPWNTCCSLQKWNERFEDAWFQVQFFCLFTADFSQTDSSRNVFPLCMEKNEHNVLNGHEKQESVSLVLREFELHHCFNGYVANSPGRHVQFLDSRDELVRKIKICGCYDPADRWEPEDLTRKMPKPTRLPLPRHGTPERLQYVLNTYNVSWINETHIEFH